VHISPDNGHKESSVFVSVYPVRIFQGKWQRVSKAIDDLWTINLKVLYSSLSCAVDFQLVLDCWIYKSLVTDLWAGHPSKGSAQLSSNSKSKFEGSPFRLRLIIMLSLADNSIIFLYFSYVYKYLYIFCSAGRKPRQRTSLGHQHCLLMHFQFLAGSVYWVVHRRRRLFMQFMAVHCCPDPGQPRISCCSSRSLLQDHTNSAPWIHCATPAGKEVVAKNWYQGIHEPLINQKETCNSSHVKIKTILHVWNRFTFKKRYTNVKNFQLFKTYISTDLLWVAITFWKNKWVMEI